MGKPGVWYWNSRHVSFLDDDSWQVPVLEHAGDAPHKPTLYPSLAPIGFNATFGMYTSKQVNVDAQGRNIVGDAANEPSLAVDPKNRNHILVGWRQFDSVTSNFRQAGNAYTLDGGNTWHKNAAITPGEFRSDPVLGVDAKGNFFYDSLEEIFYTDIFKSVTGSSWSFDGPAAGGDKQWMTVDATSSTGSGNMYESWSTAGNNYGGRQFSRSTDGGATWMDPINIPGYPVWGTLDVNPSGDLYLCGLGDTEFQFSRSTNAKNAAQTPTFDLNVPVDLGGAIVTGSSLNPDGLLGQTWIVTDKSVGKYRGNIYMLCSVGVGGNNPCDVHLAKSTDGGNTWSAWQRINDDAPNTGASHWFGTLAIAPGGRLDVCWYDNRANPSLPNSALFYSSSYDGGETWTKSIQVSNSFDPTIGWPNQQKIGDYIGMVSDNTGANIVYSATFNSEEDIWFLRIPCRAIMPLDATAIAPYHGTYVGGTVSSVQLADGHTYDLNSITVPNLGDVVDAQVDFVCPMANPGALAVNVKASAPALSTGLVWLYNWTNQTFDYFQSFEFGSNGLANQTVNLTSTPSAYVDSSGKVRMLVRALRPARLSNSAVFKLQLDLVQLLYG